ncbi:hypothetical protein ACH5RR_039653 [Cinchona calisaya]|uniref:Reverse transcriptase/retrotransposon-derived protein RNase H-like domain-containing protein n=1 Tax=Cinchona calisaya TaxID=153742 RepID=A0ABD2Y426_9GENT
MIKWLKPGNLKQLRGSVGLTRYYRRFVKEYRVIGKPLTDMLKKDNFKWNEEAGKAFKRLKLSMSTTPAMALPNFSKPFIVETDASNEGIGVVLMQEKRPIESFRKLIS